ncbi:MAG: iron-containing alcohol dehydrogenase, partial [Candidatus Bathyarchaeia archaeon]
MDLNALIGKTYIFQLPKKIIFGMNSSRLIGVEVKALSGSKVLLVTDNNLRTVGVTREIEEVLSEEDLVFEIFSDIKAEPNIEFAEKVAEFARKNRYDLVVGVGGGSVLDMAKVASIAITNPGSVRSYIGVDLVKKPGLPKILMPTTAGTGSEVTRVAVITLEDEEAKSAIISPYLISDVAIVDPKLTFSMPQKITASTGLDALSHALEAIMAVNANPITDALALQAIKVISEYLPRSYRSGDVESRVNMSLGSLMAGMAFANSWVCLGHALAYSFSVAYKVPHGVSCGLALPYAFKFNMPAISHKIPQIAEAIGLPREAAADNKLGELIMHRLLSLLADLNVPRRLKDVGVPESDIEKIAG